MCAPCSVRMKRARAHRAARLDAARDSIANYLPVKLYGAEDQLLEAGMQERKQEQSALLVAYTAFVWNNCNQIYLPAVITVLAGGRR